MLDKLLLSFFPFFFSPFFLSFFKSFFFFSFVIVYLSVCRLKRGLAHNVHMFSVVLLKISVLIFNHFCLDLAYALTLN